MDRFIHVEPKNFTHFSDLPFVFDKGRGKNKQASNWHIPDNLNYGEACRLGKVYAIYFMQHLLDSRESAGSNTIGWLVGDMHQYEETDGKGVAVGFFSALETFLHYTARNVDIWHWLDEEIEQSFEFERKWAAESLLEKTSVDMDIQGVTI